MSANTLRDRVFENLKAVEDNGYYESGDGKPFWQWTAEEIATDMLAFADNVEDETIKRLIPHVQAYLDQREQT